MALARFSFRTTQDVSFDVLADPADGGHLARRARNGFELRRFSLEWPIVQTAEKDAIVAEFDAAKGAAGTLMLTHPDYGTLEVLAVESQLTIRRRGAGRWAVSLTVEVER